MPSNFVFLLLSQRIVHSVFAGIVVGGGGFAVLGLLSIIGRTLHPDTRQVYLYLWVALTFTFSLEILNIDIFIGGYLELLHISLISMSTVVSATVSLSLSDGDPIWTELHFT
jgi:hypothetical protein